MYHTSTWTLSAWLWPGSSSVLQAVLREALENGVQASADDAIEPASWETTYGMREAD